MRFAFGKNWRSFLALLDERRIDESIRAITAALGGSSLEGLRVLDIGSGSGLSSLAMRRLGATVVSFDYDADSVACTNELKERFYPGDTRWDVSQGSVLDARYMASLGTFDLVYTWGVLHHTGNMWQAIDLSIAQGAPEGRMIIALYNDQGWRSRAWWHVKRTYCSGRVGRMVTVAFFYPLFAAYAVYLDIRQGRAPGTHAKNYATQRGMSLTHDWKDWLGGYPFEVATPGQVRAVFAAQGFSLARERLTRGWGCNEFVFQRNGAGDGV
jgi:SAM-dependent methyltransferase